MKYLSLTLTIVLLNLICRAQAPELVIPIGHKFGIRSVCFSPDDKMILSAGIDKSIKLWDAKSGMLLRTIHGSDPMREALFSPDGRYIIASTLKGVILVETSTGKPLQKFDCGIALSARITNDNKLAFIYSVIDDHEVITIWDVLTGKIIRELSNIYNQYSTSRAFVTGFREGQGKNIALNNNSTLVIGPLTEYSVGIWETKTGELIHRLSHRIRINSSNFSPDGKQAVTTDESNGVYIWDVKTGSLIKSIKTADTKWGTNLALFKSGEIILLSETPRNNEYNESTWVGDSTRLLKATISDDTTILAINFNKKGDQIVTGSADNSINVWDSSNGKLLSKTVSSKEISFAKLSKNKSTIGVSFGNHVVVLDASTGNMLNKLQGVNPYSKNGLELSSTGELIVWADAEHKIKLLDRRTGSTRELIKPNNRAILTSLRLDDPEKSVYAIYDDSVMVNFDVQSGSINNQLIKINKQALSVGQNGKFITLDTREQKASVYDNFNSQPDVYVYNKGDDKTGFEERVTSAISPNDQYIAINNLGDSLKVWDIKTKQILVAMPSTTDVYADVYWTCYWYRSGYFACVPDQSHLVTGNFFSLRSIEFSDDSKRVTFPTINQKSIIYNLENKETKIINGSIQGVNWQKGLGLVIDNSELKLVDLESDSVRLTWIPVGESDFVITHPSGLFDASPGAMSKLYFISGFDKINFNQLKTRYYEPGLWRKVMSGEKLRDVVGFNNVELPPDVRVGQVDKKGNLPIEVINKGGGIGEITLYINGKEVIKDIRKPRTDAKSPSLNFSIPVSAYKNLIPGTQNFLAVKAWNAGHWIESRGTVVEYIPPTKSEINPAVHILVCGVSDYTGNEIDLKYAAKDAEDIAKALELGAKRLFGVDRSFVYTLTTNQKTSSYPTKTNIVNTFNKISSTASSADVIVVYLSGHGINIGGADGDFHYLTQEAYTASANAYNDPAIKHQSTLSSQELVELFKKVPALKQVLMIDACASGKVVDNLMAKKDIESGTLRALDRMKDRTGMHIITGCTADAVSYEASRYGQGILTYSLLEGIRGLALREDKFIDVNTLFQFAQDRVPILAAGIGGIQTPQVFSPNGSQSFDVGELNSEEKKQIPIANARPVYVRSNFIDEQKLRDVLGLGKKMDGILNEISARGSESQILFVDVSEYPEGCQLSGLYKQVEGKIILKLSKVCSEKETTYNLEANTEDELAKNIIDLVNK